MRAQPMDWRGFLTDWVWPFAKTAVTSAVYASSPFWVFTIPIAAIGVFGLLFGIGSVDTVLGLFFMTGFVIACVLAVLVVGMACIGLPVSAYLAWRGSESKRAYKWAGAFGGAAIPVLAAFARSGEINGSGFGGIPGLLFSLGYCAAIGAITASLWWQNARDPYLETAGIITPMRGFGFRLLQRRS